MCVYVRERERKRERDYPPAGRAMTHASSGSKCNDLVLDVEGGNPSQGAQVWMFQRNETNAQKWR